MTLREGQKRVEVTPGHFAWLNEADRKAMGLEPEAPVKASEVEAATAEAPERATMPRPQANRKRR